MNMNKDIVLTRAQIEEHIWDYNYEGSSNMIDVYIRYLRKKIDEEFSPKLIHTVRGRGYVLRVEKG
jgi:DNA-binding response OmpR family regulator